MLFAVCNAFFRLFTFLALPRYDETFRRDSPSLQPAHTHTKRPKKAERKKRVKVMMDEKHPLSVGLGGGATQLLLALVV